MSLALVPAKPHKKMGRPTKYTPEVVARLLQAIRLGATYEGACGYAGISEDSLAAWRETKSGFIGQLKEAEGVAIVGWLAKIEKAANDGEWQAAAWKLERRYPKDYGRRINEHTGQGGAPLPMTVVYVNDWRNDRELSS